MTGDLCGNSSITRLFLKSRGVGFAETALEKCINEDRRTEGNKLAYSCIVKDWDSITVLLAIVCFVVRYFFKGG